MARKTYEIRVYPDGHQDVVEVRSGRKIATFQRFSDAKAFKAMKEQQSEVASVRNRRANRKLPPTRTLDELVRDVLT